MILDQQRRSFNRLRSLITLMRCPETHEPLLLTDEGQLRAELSGRQWGAPYGVPNFLPVAPIVYSDDHISNAIAPDAQDLIDGSTSLVLNVSAGGTVNPPANVVEIESNIFRNTDIVGDVHNLPFKDEMFDTIICLNAFEHYHSPIAASAELHRILNKDGIILIHTAFLQPIHEAPNHFFGCTEYGLAKWFERFDLVDLKVPPNFNPLYALSWFASELELGMRGTMPTVSDQIGAITLMELAQFWRTRQDVAMEAAFTQIPDEIQRRLATGYQYVGRKSTR